MLDVVVWLGGYGVGLITATTTQSTSGLPPGPVSTTSAIYTKTGEPVLTMHPGAPGHSRYATYRQATVAGTKRDTVVRPVRLRRAGRGQGCSMISTAQVAGASASYRCGTSPAKVA